MSDDPLVVCTADIDEQVLAAIRAAWAAEGVDVEASRASQARADAEFERRLDERPELITSLEAGNFDVLEALIEQYDQTPVRPHAERFEAANRRLLREHPDLVEALAARYREVMSWSDLSEKAAVGLWMSKHTDALDQG